MFQNLACHKLSKVRESLSLIQGGQKKKVCLGEHLSSKSKRLKIKGLVNTYQVKRNNKSNNSDPNTTELKSRKHWKWQRESV